MFCPNYRAKTVFGEPRKCSERNSHDAKPWWVHWVLLGWGAGVISHAVKIYHPGMKSGKNWSKDWEEKKIRELMDDWL